MGEIGGEAIDAQGPLPRVTAGALEAKQIRVVPNLSSPLVE
jgi:hypothetical protein